MRSSDGPPAPATATEGEGPGRRKGRRRRAPPGLAPDQLVRGRADGDALAGLEVGEAGRGLAGRGVGLLAGGGLEHELVAFRGDDLTRDAGGARLLRGG